MARAKIPLALGPGLDRATGLAATNPSYPSDARNVYARDAKQALRPGITTTAYPPLPWGTDLIAVVPIKATGDELYCVYDRTSRELRIFRLNVATNEMQPLNSPANGLWGTLGALTPFPVVTAAEVNGLVFFAHDEGAVPFRLVTIYYTPFAASPDLPGTLTTLTADLDGDGVQAAVKFRGVYAYLEYLVGWGWGSEESAEEEDRGDVLRLSKPAAPTIFPGGSYALCGARADPIRAVVATEDVLAIAKADEAYKLVGSSGLDFGVFLLDARYGAVSSRCAQNIGGIAYWWSSDGARQVRANGTFPIAQPLELLSPLPDTLPTPGPSRFCFAVYDRRRYLLEFVFPNVEDVTLRTLSFALSLWNPEDPRWSFIVREQCVGCAGEIIVSDEAEVPAPTGYCSDVAGADTGIAPDPRFRSVNVSWQNNDAVGDEIVQIFAKPAGGAWTVALALPVSGVAQNTAVQTLDPLTAYEIALRYVRGQRTAEGYEGGDPDAWTAPTAAGAMDSFNTSSAVVAWVAGAFTSAAAPVNLSWASAQLAVPYLLEKDIGAGFVTVAADLVATTYAYAIPGAELGTTVDFRVTPKRGAIAGAAAAPDLSVPMFITVGTPNWVSAVWSAVTGIATLTWSAAANATTYFLEKSTDGGGSWLPVATVATTSYAYAAPAAEINTTVKFRVTGKNGATSGVASATQDVTFTVNLVAPVLLSAVQAAPGNRFITANWSAGSGDVTHTALEFNAGAGWFAALRQFGAVAGPASRSIDVVTGGALPVSISVRVSSEWIKGSTTFQAPSNVLVVNMV